jgi:hypothetical protein
LKKGKKSKNGKKKPGTAIQKKGSGVVSRLVLKISN